MIFTFLIKMAQYK